MASFGPYFVILFLVVQTTVVSGQDEIKKSSLAFIIDDTGSMWDEIRQVKEEVNIIFEKVLSSRASQIENFVLVTFNDPTTQLRTITKDKNEYKRAVAGISVHGGDDCPEYAMAGIELGLKESLPLSYLYVFTDASAKDHARCDEINSLAQKKQSQVVFILTGLCGSRSGADYQVYHKVAEATNGQVFHMMKDDVKDILKYVEESITGRGIPLVNEKLEPGYGKIVKFTLDNHTTDTLISITGEEPKIGKVTGPDGSTATTVDVISGKSEVVITKIPISKPGVHTVEVGSKSETHAMITAKSDLNFQLGFSVIRPNSIKETVSRPAPEGNAFIGVKLLGNGVKFTTAKILDMSNNVITELPLQLLDEKEKFYITPSFNPPYTTFRVSVTGNDVGSESPIVITSSTPISRQNPSTEKKVNTAPEITIEGGPAMIVDYDAPLQLKCNVHGYPKPDVTWEERDTGIKLPAKVEIVEVPYDYISILDIDKANKNVTYECKASNIVGVNIKYVQVETKRKIYFDVKEAPKDIRVEYNKEESLSCKVDAYPPASITWYKDGKMVSGDEGIDLSSDKSILTIKQMQLNLKGQYMCEAKNDRNRKIFMANVEISGVETPVIHKFFNETRVTEKTNAVLSCRILKGIPKPRITWSFRPAGGESFRIITDTTETIHFDNVDKGRTGSYRCLARNDLGSDEFTMKLVVEYPPKIRDDLKEITKKDDDEVRISCDASGEPTPTVTWFFNDIRFNGTAKSRITGDQSLRFKARLSDIGYYRCEATNKFGVANKTAFLNVHKKPAIDKSHEEIRVTEKTNAVLSCRILIGNPKPSITWTFRPAGDDIFREMSDTTETIHFDNVDIEQAGSYRCVARNDLGSDQFKIELIVEHPPKIKDDLVEITKKDDDEVRISCDASGEPTPTVTWFFNDIRFDSTAKSRITGDQSLRFNARLADTGYYRCDAVNKLGIAKKTAFLYVYIPVTIEAPKKSTIEVMVGKSTILNCRADGYPRPNIEWTFQSSDSMLPAKDITPTSGVASVTLRNIQLHQQGLYTCKAENGVGGSANITYDVKVYAPPVIHNTYLSKMIEVVSGDPTLQIQCKAKGSPKPSIVWIKDGLNVAIGSDWYDIEEDGTLVIKNIDADSQGTYVCLAQNVLGNATEAYEVVVTDTVEPEIPTSTVFVPEGKTINITCDLPHKSTDQMRWYKDGVAIASGELTLYSVTLSEDGLYTCRISDTTKSRSVTTKVTVGFKPKFTTEEEETIDFVHGADTEFLSCEAYGEPRPTTAIWKHNGKVLNTTSMSHPLGMEYGATGIYECEVSNDFGTIRRTFTVTSRECLLDLKKDFPEKQPIMISPSLEWPVFEVKDGYMIISHQDYFYLNCPSLFSNSKLPSATIIQAYCERDNTIKINGRVYKFSDIQCNDEAKAQVMKTGMKCLSENTETVKIGYKVYGEFMSVYEVCLDKDNNVPLFAKHKLSPYYTDRSTKAEWSNSVLPQDFDTLYDCRRQVYDISIALRRGLSTFDACCFGKRQLVSSRNLRPGIPTSAAYDYVNVIPHWSTCNSKNWEDVEQSVRNLVTSAGRDLIVTTGTANPHSFRKPTDITLQDARDGNQKVAPYLWKVVQDRVQAASLAIIQINIPELSEEEAEMFVLCPDICASYISWIDPSNYHNVDDGYTFCCSIADFEKAFDYIGRFSTETKYVLFEAEKMPEYYLSKK